MPEEKTVDAEESAVAPSGGHVVVSNAGSDVHREVDGGRSLDATVG